MAGTGSSWLAKKQQKTPATIPAAEPEDHAEPIQNAQHAVVAMSAANEESSARPRSRCSTRGDRPEPLSMTVGAPPWNPGSIRWRKVLHSSHALTSASMRAHRLTFRIVL